MTSTSPDDVQQSSPDRFGRLIERPDGRDFPFYNREPVEIATWKWVVIIVACAAGFAALTLIPQPNNVVGLVPRILFPAIPLALFIALTGQYWRTLFHRLTGRDVLTMVVFWLLNLAVTGLVGLIISAVAPTAPNSATDNVLDGGALEVVAFYAGTGIQLFGEEIFTILPFLAVLYWLHTKAKLGRKTAIIIAWLVTAVWFGAAHLPTYDWNVVQAIIGIGVARLVLTLAYIRTKNILVSTGAHVLNDWSGFTFGLVVAAAAG